MPEVASEFGRLPVIDKWRARCADVRCITGANVTSPINSDKCRRCVTHKCGETVTTPGDKTINNKSMDEAENKDTGSDDPGNILSTGGSIFAISTSVRTFKNLTFVSPRFF